MTAFEPFTLIEGPSSLNLFDTFKDVNSGKVADPDIQYVAALRKAFPEYIVTSIPTANCNLLSFAQAGHATAELDLETDSYASWRGWIPALRAGQKGVLGESIFFAKYRFQWSSEYFLLYTVRNVQYVLKERLPGEDVLSHSAATDALIAAAGTWQTADQKIIWIYDYTTGWRRSKELFNSVEKTEWKDVILDENMKKALTEVSTKFFDSEDVYENLGVPWKRGVLFYGPPGNGKTISIKALMHTLLKRNVPVPTLYVKAAPNTYAIRIVFTFARQLAPCLLVFEDIDTVVTANTRSYFFNEVDGLENNDGILMAASTNHLDRLDPGITKRPSRFDRKYLFPLPSEHERELYCDFWRLKLQKQRKSHVDFPKKLCSAIASITDEFSFAYLQEAFVATLLAIAGGDSELGNATSASNIQENQELDRYQLWVVIKKQIEILKEDMQNGTITTSEQLEGGNIVCEVVGTLETSTGQHGDLPVLASSPVQDLPSRKYQYINPTSYAWQ